MRSHDPVLFPQGISLKIYKSLFLKSKQEHLKIKYPSSFAISYRDLF